MGRGVKKGRLRSSGTGQTDRVPDSWRVSGVYRPASEAGVLASRPGSTGSHAHSWSDAGLHHPSAIAGHEEPYDRSTRQPADSRDRLVLSRHLKLLEKLDCLSELRIPARIHPIRLRLEPHRPEARDRIGKKLRFGRRHYGIALRL